MNHKSVERIWRKEGLKVPKKQPKRGRLWLTDGSCIRLRPEYKDHVWNYDLMMARTAEGKAFRILTLIDEYTRECLTILTQRRITSQDVIEQLFYLFMFRGTPQHIRSDNGPEFTAKAVRNCLRSIDRFSTEDKKEAEAAFDLPEGRLSAEAKEAFGDYIMHFIVKQAIHYNLPLRSIRVWPCLRVRVL